MNGGKTKEKIMRIVDSWEMDVRATTIGIRMYYGGEEELKVCFAVTPEKARCLSKALHCAVERIELATKRKIIPQRELDARIEKFLEDQAAIKDEKPQGPPNQEVGEFENTNN